MEPVCVATSHGLLLTVIYTVVITIRWATYAALMLVWMRYITWCIMQIWGRLLGLQIWPCVYIAPHSRDFILMFSC